MRRNKVENIHVLLIEDDSEISKMILSYLKNDEYYTVSKTNSEALALKEYECTFDVIHKETLKEAVDCILAEGDEKFDVVLVALGLPNGEGLEVFEKINNCCKSCPIIIISKYIEEALEAVKRGAQDYIYKPNLTREVLIKAIRYAILRKNILLKKTRETEVEAAIYDIFINILKSEWTFDILSKIIKEKITEFTESDLVYIGILNEEGTEINGEGQKEFYEKICKCHDDCFPGYRLIVNKFNKAHNFWGMAYNSGEALLINDIIEYRNRVNPADCEVSAKNLILVPITFNNKIVGQVSVANKIKGWYTQFDINLVKRLANMFAVSLQKLNYETQINKEKEQFRKLVETTQAIIYSISFNAHDKFVFVNDVMCQKTGYTKEELLGIKLENLLSPRSYHDFVERLKKLAKGEPIEQTTEYEIIGKNGNIGWVLITAEHLYDNNSHIVGANVIGIDITEKKKIEESLHIYQERLSLALEATTDGIWEYDIRTGKTYYSPRYQKMLGYGPEELEPSVNTWISLLHPEDHDRCVEELNKMYKGLPTKLLKGNVYTNQFRMKCKNGEYKWIQSRGKILEYDDDGTPARFIGSHLDITAEKELEIALRKEERERNSLVESKISEVIEEFSSYDTYHDLRVKQLDDIIQSLEDVSFPLGVRVHG